jgi:hypothetical protein
MRHHSTWTAWIGLFTFISLEAVGVSTAVAPDVGGSSVQRAAARGPRQGFERNQGQVGPEFAFVTRGDGYELLLGPTEAALWLPQTDGSGKGDRRDGQERTPSVLRLSYLGAQLPSVVGMERLPGRVHYLVGREPERWRTNIPRSPPSATGIYPGVNPSFAATSSFEFTFAVAPGRIRRDPARGEGRPEPTRPRQADPTDRRERRANGPAEACPGSGRRRAGSGGRVRNWERPSDRLSHLGYDPERPLFLQLRPGGLTRAN